ncbi:MULTISPECIES: filamentous hemagglutinin N-terminal domain-containing protein [unclassified Cupriavidus]|uniref:filamentous hemagglutinin N-terminal domain-containing protein n=1 Tax=Cupriavidus sp. H19C3 TaxID=3241603 RepID=UPI003BF8784A
MNRVNRRKACAAAVLSGAACTVSPVAGAQSVAVAAGNGEVRAYVAANGATVVDIAAANAAGVSHNRYERFHVDAAGLVLNNSVGNGAGHEATNAAIDRAINRDDAAASRLVATLGATLAANPNLAQPAGIILNEVIGNGRSLLAGTTAVHGTRADLVVANPYGITCMGCGFDNTSRVLLTTGVPQFGSSGALDGFAVRQGDIEVRELDASNTALLDLVARSVRLTSKLEARDLYLGTGVGRFGYAGRALDGPAESSPGTPPSGRALDSTALGGIYADRIRIQATEAGTGVRMLGDAAARASDFTLTASGDVELAGAVSARGNIAVVAAPPLHPRAGAPKLPRRQAAARAQHLRVAPAATLQAGGDIAIGAGTAEAGAVARFDVHNQGRIHADTGLALHGQRLLNIGRLSAGKVLSLRTTDLVNRGEIVSGGVLDIATPRFSDKGTIVARHGIKAPDLVRVAPQRAMEPVRSGPRRAADAMHTRPPRIELTRAEPRPDSMRHGERVRVNPQHVAHMMGAGQLGTAEPARFHLRRAVAYHGPDQGAPRAERRRPGHRDQALRVGEDGASTLVVSVGASGTPGMTTVATVDSRDGGPARQADDGAAQAAAHAPERPSSQPSSQQSGPAPARRGG